MNPNREQEIFSSALELDTEAERSAFLDSSCANRPEVRQRVEVLLRAAAAAGNFMSEATAEVQEGPGSRVGHYRLREQIGEGGFGVIYHAEQEEPVRRSVALKIIKLGMDTRAVVARFEAERQALAMMEHPNIARVFDGGATTAGRPYFVMELVRGEPITVFCRERRLRLKDRLELFLQVCAAVHHAHQKGVIHRDLKPSNILVTCEGNRPTAKVIDFGIAKATHEPLTEKTLRTRLHVLLGTPAYMSPEQVGPGDGDVDTRSDIYSLGAVLYELLADSPALDAQTLATAGLADIQRMIHRVEALPPSQRLAALPPEARREVALRRHSNAARLVGDVRGDLDRIVLKCLEKDRARRYETTEDLARDITRYLHDEPVLAQPPTLRYMAAKFVRRHRRGVATGAVALLLLFALGIYHGERLATERDRAQLEAQKAAKVSELLTELLIAGDPFRTQVESESMTQGMIESRVRQEFAGQPEVRADILNAIGRVYLRRGESDKALPVLTEALAAGRAIGRPDERLAQTLSDLGILWRERGDYAFAVRLVGEALALRRQLAGNESNEVAVSLSELGRVYVAQERLDLAEPLLRESLAIRRKVLGPEDREIATNLGDLGFIYWQKGDLAEAESTLQQSAAMHQRTVGANHPNLAGTKTYLARLKVDQGDLPGAERLLREALEIYRRSVGATHWRSARTLGILGDVWRREGRLAEAETALDQARQFANATLGPGRPLVVDLTIDRARVYLDRGEAAAAEPLLREALVAQQHFFGEGGWQVASTKSLLGAALLGLGRFAEAEPLLRQANGVLKDIPGPQGRETKPTRERIATLSRMNAGS